MTKTYSVLTRAKPADAFAYVADVARHPEWSPDSMQVTAETGGRVRVGSTFKTVGNLMGKPNPATVEIVSVDPPRRFAFRAIDGNSEWLHEFSFTPTNGGTQIDRRVTVVRGPALLKLVFPFLHPFVIGPGNMKSMTMLKDRLETASPVTA